MSFFIHHSAFLLIRVIRDIRGCLFSATSAISACHAVAVAEAGGENGRGDSPKLRELSRVGAGGSHQGAAPIAPYLVKDCAILGTPQKSKK